jgi:hypothetical protein
MLSVKRHRPSFALRCGLIVPFAQDFLEVMDEGHYGGGYVVPGWEIIFGNSAVSVVSSQRLAYLSF